MYSYLYFQSNILLQVIEPQLLCKEEIATISQSSPNKVWELFFILCTRYLRNLGLRRRGKNQSWIMNITINICTLPDPLFVFQKQFLLELLLKATCTVKAIGNHIFFIGSIVVSSTATLFLIRKNQIYKERGRWIPELFKG